MTYQTPPGDEDSRPSPGRAWPEPNTLIRTWVAVIVATGWLPVVVAVLVAVRPGSITGTFGLVTAMCIFAWLLLSAYVRSHLGFLPWRNRAATERAEGRQPPLPITRPVRVRDMRDGSTGWIYPEDALPTSRTRAAIRSDAYLLPGHNPGATIPITRTRHGWTINSEPDNLTGTTLTQGTPPPGWVQAHRNAASNSMSDSDTSPSRHAASASAGE